MSRIHHTQATKAEKLGVRLEEDGQFVKAIWPMRNMTIFGVDAKWAIEQIEAMQRLVRHAEERGSEISARASTMSPTQVHLIIDGEPTQVYQSPIMWWQNREKIQFDSEPRVAIAVDTSLTPAEQAEVDAEEKKPPVGRSVVKQKFRAIYSEAGHPTTCGDELAEKLDNLIKNAKGTNIDYFGMILKANEVDMSKYKTTGSGWQGRWRMTGRNMLAKKVHASGGVLKLPTGETLQMSADWVALQRYQK